MLDIFGAEITDRYFDFYGDKVAPENMETYLLSQLTVTNNKAIVEQLCEIFSQDDFESVDLLKIIANMACIQICEELNTELDIANYLGMTEIRVESL